MDADKEFQSFLSGWVDTEDRTKAAFVELSDFLNSLGEISLDFKARPGVSYSLRPRHSRQVKRELFVMLDVIDDDPGARWLSICFYGDMLTDPEERGDLIPEGLLGEDGYCFDLDEYDEDSINYLKARIAQAHKSASLEE